VNLRLAFTGEGIDGVVTLRVPAAGPVSYRCELRGIAVGSGIVLVRDDDVPPSRSGRLEFRADGLWTEAVCETPGEHWSFGLEAFGLRVDAIEDAVGERIAVGYDLEWEVGDLVHGDVLLGRTTLPVTGRGTLAVG
jgi:hypothetical protein